MRECHKVREWQNLWVQALPHTPKAPGGRGFDTAGVLTCRRANEHQGDATSPALHDEGQVAWRDVCCLLGVVTARNHVVHAVRLNLAQEHHL